MLTWRPTAAPLPADAAGVRLDTGALGRMRVVADKESGMEGAAFDVPLGLAPKILALSEAATAQVRERAGGEGGGKATLDRASHSWLCAISQPRLAPHP